MSKAIISGTLIVFTLAILSFLYIMQDTDADGTVDLLDNCDVIKNFWQLDYDIDKIGNECDVDDDNDGVVDSLDQFDFNSDEWVDSDSDGLGDSSDRDDNNNGIFDFLEN